MNRPSRRSVICAVVSVSALLAAHPALASSVESEWASSESIVPQSISDVAVGQLSDLDNYLGRPDYAKFLTQPVAWSVDNCPGTAATPVTPTTLECALVDVPMNWHNLAEGTMKVGMSRQAGDADVLAARSKRLLVGNPGGPGASGLAWTHGLPALIGAADSHVTVGIDIRGVNLSSRVECTDPAPLPAGSHRADGDSTTYTKESVQVTQSYADQWIKACHDSNPQIKYINSEQIARDFTFIRALLGYQTADFYGASYGSWLGAVAAKMFPNQFDRVILDGNTDWGSGNLEQSFRHQPEGFQAAHDTMWLPFVARHHDKYGLGHTTVQVDDTIHRLRDAVRAGKIKDWTVDDFNGMLFSTLYRPARFVNAAKTLSAMQKELNAPTPGVAAELQAARASLSSPLPPQSYNGTVFAVIQCSDTANSKDFERWYATQEPIARRYPLIGWDFLNMSCAGWPSAPALTDEVMKRPMRNVVMFQNEGDPATPYSPAARFGTNTPGVRFVGVDDRVGHLYPMGDTPCAYDAAKAFMVNGVFPERNIGCQAGPILSSMERTVFEYFNRKSMLNPVVRPFSYPQRVLKQPAIDVAATNAWQAANPLADKPARTAIGSDEYATAAQAAEALAEYSTPMLPAVAGGARR